MKTNESILSDVRLYDLRPENEDFTRCRCSILYTGKNRNNSFITEDALKKFIDRKGYANVPVVAHLQKDEKGSYFVGGHDTRIVISDDEIEIVGGCVPFGVIPEDCSPAVEIIEEPSGKKRGYFSVDVLLWTHRYPIIDAASDSEIMFSQSMEAVFNETHTENGTVIVDDFSISALCLLGIKNGREIEPCFEAAALRKKDALKKSFGALMTRLGSFEAKKIECGCHSLRERTDALEQRIAALESALGRLGGGFDRLPVHSAPFCGPEYETDLASERYGELLKRVKRE